MRFSTKLSIVIAIVFLAGFSAMFYLGYTSTTGIVEQNVKERLEGQAFQVIDKIDRMLFERYADIGVLATDPVLRSRTSTPAQITRRLAEYQGKYRIYSSLSFFNMNRVRIADTAGKQIGEQHALTEYWREIAGGRDVATAITEAQTTKQVVIHFVAAVRDGHGRRTGIVVSRMPIESIHQIADQTFRSNSVHGPVRVELLDMNGLILYSSYNGKGMFREQSSDWENIVKLLLQGGSVGSARHAFQGEEEITAFAREQGYDTFKGNGWVLTVCVPVKIAFAAANGQAIKFTALFLGIGVVVILITFLVSRVATKPVHELSRAAAEIGKGNRDVSVRVRSEDELGQLAKAFNAMARDLKESENKYKDLAELLPQIVFEIDAKGSLTFVNRLGLDMFGYTQQDVEKGLSFLDVFVPEDRTRLGENMGKRLGGEKGDSIEYTAVRKDGSIFPFLVFTEPIRRDDRVLGIRGIGIDITDRKCKENELRQREWQLAEAQRLAHLGSWFWRVDEDKATWTDELYRMLGLNPGEVVPMIGTYLQFVHPDDRSTTEKAASDAMADGTTTDIEHRIIRNDGAVRFFHSQTEVIRDASGKMVLFRGVVRDITERKRAETSLRQNEALYRSLVNTTDTGYVVVDREGNVLDANEEYLRLSGHRNLSEIRGRSVLEWTAEYEKKKNEKAIAQCAAEGFVRNFEVDYVDGQGRVTPIEINATVVEKDGMPQILTLCRDISGRKTAEERLRLSAEEWQRTFDAISDCVSIHDNEMTVVRANMSLGKFLGRPPEELIGKKCYNLFHNTDEPIESCPLQKTLHSGKSESLEFREPSLGCWLSVSCYPIYDAKKEKIAGTVHVARDITERKRTEDDIRRLNEELELKVEERTKLLLDAQEELIRKEKLSTLGQVAGSVGHELRNPLGVMNNAVYFLQTVLADADEKTKEYLNIIKSEIFGAERIVSDLLEAVRTKPPQRQRVRTEDLIRMSLENCRIPESVKVEVLSGTQRSVLIDLLQMKQVFINLFNNAVDAMPEGGVLRVNARMAKDEGRETRDEKASIVPVNEASGRPSSIEVSVSDTGAGITPENVKKLFQPLFSTKARGIGLGLVVVKNLTEANGGKISVQSEVGKGTIFTILLPAGEA